MATDVLDEHRFTSQASLYEPSSRNRLSKDTTRRTLTASSTNIYNATPSTTTTRLRRIRYSTQGSIPAASITTTNTIQQRNSVSNDLISLFRSFAIKPFRATTISNSTVEGQTNHTFTGNPTNSKIPVSLIKIRPLSENISDHSSSLTDSTRQIEIFLKRMGWPVNSTTDEARLKWRIAMKFLIPVKFDVNRAITLYRTHENIRKSENLDRIWITNPHLIREIQSNKFFSLLQVSNQPLTVCFIAANFFSSTSTHSVSQQDRELIALQALICQLDVHTESLEVQQNGLNFIYDMQNCSASQFDMNLSRKVLKLLQGGYPAMVKNIFIISAPKWFKIAYKVLMYTPDQMRETLLSQYNYPLDRIPIAFGGLFDPTSESDTRYQTCLSTVTNPQSICSIYYSQEYQPITTKSSSNILFFNTDHHPHHQQNSDGNVRRTSSPTSLVAIVALRRNHESLPIQTATARKRQSSSSSDSEKRRRSNESLIEEEEEPPSSSSKLSTYIPQDILFK